MQNPLPINEELVTEYRKNLAGKGYKNDQFSDQDMWDFLSGFRPIDPLVDVEVYKKNKAKEHNDAV